MLVNLLLQNHGKLDFIEESRRLHQVVSFQDAVCDEKQLDQIDRDCQILFATFDSELRDGFIFSCYKYVSRLLQIRFQAASDILYTFPTMSFLSLFC